MKQENYISVKTFCQHHGVKESFVYSMYEFELLQIDDSKEEALLSTDELPILEKMVRLHKELDINPEGVQAVYHLLQQVEGLQEEVAALKRKLDRFDF
ncbi:MAG: chaperone modulator CbpM [Flavobacteriaceae bacterium]|uniref:chaperone modulator CbpM n=1 Tax=Flagellimonas TaxID=444459 RepID=UPI003BAD066F|nr:chaperone modulator CbpM [Flavobacteriaceae bacterium]